MKIIMKLLLIACLFLAACETTKPTATTTITSSGGTLTFMDNKVTWKVL